MSEKFKIGDIVEFTVEGKKTTGKIVDVEDTGWYRIQTHLTKNGALIARSFCVPTHNMRKVSPIDQKIKADAGKPRLSLVPLEILPAIARVREYGITKYGDSEGWRKVKPGRYIDALLRHVFAFTTEPLGLDDESGLPHLWHVATNVAFLCEMYKDKFAKVSKEKG